MYSIIAGALLFFLFVMLSSRCTKETFAGNFVISCGFGVAGAFVGMLAAFLLGTRVPVKTTRIGTFALVSMRTTGNLSGTFICGTGSVKTSAVYRVYVKNPDGSCTPYTLPADPSASIFEDAGSRDQGQWIVMQTSYDYSAPLAKWALNVQDEPRICNQFHVPKGTVLNDFSAQ